MIIKQHEIAFIDRNVDDLAALLAGLRSEVEPIVLSTDAPAPRQMAEVLQHRSDLAAIHLIAHGAPGQVNCGASALALETIEHDGEDLATIGRALGDGGSLQLWACNAARGERGATFVDALARATGVEVLAATGLVGAAALGGDWELRARSGASEARAPLTAHGMANYVAVMATKTWTGGGTTSNPNTANWSSSGSWSPSGAPAAGDDVVIGGNSGGSYTVTLDVASATPALNSLTINFTGNTATLSIGSGKTLNVTNTVSLTGTNTISMSGGMVNAGTLTLTGASANVTGFGTLNVSGHYTSTGRLTATGGTLDVFGTVDSGVVLTIGTSPNSNLKIEGTATSAAAISISNANQTLEIGAGGNLTISAAQSITNGKIQLDGGTLTDASGLTIGSSATLTGSGTVAANIAAGTGTITASGGVLNLTGTVVASGGPGFTIATAAGSTLKFSNTATSAAITINNANQTLEIGASGSLTLTAAESITNGTIQLDGGTLTDASSLTIGSSGKLTGFGTVAANIAAGTGTITASGGALNLTGTVASGNAFTIGSGSASTLKFSNTATAATAISISSANQTLEIGTGGNLTIGVAESITNGTIVLSGGTLTDSAGVTIGSGATLSGTGTAGAITLSAGTISQTGGTLTLASITGNGSVNGTITNAAITAKGGTLDLFGSIAGTSTLAIDSSAAATLKIDGTISSGAISISSANQTLEIGATGGLTLTAAESITDGKIKLDGGTLTDASGLTIDSGASLVGKGTVAAPVNGTGTITANGGTLEFTGAVDSTSATSFHIADVVGSVLKFDGAVGTASIQPTITFDGGQGVLDLSSDTLPNFHATIANFTNGEGIKVNGASAVVLDSSGTFITVYDSAHNSLGTLNLSTSYVGSEFSVSSGTISVHADTTTPTGGTPDLIATSDSGLSHTDDVTNVTAPTFTVTLDGTVAVGDTVQLLLGGSPLAHAVTHTISFADLSAGHVDLTVTDGDLGTDGIKSISAKFTDVAGHTSTTSALAVTLDTTIATPTVALTSDTGSSASDNITKDASITVSAAAGDVTRTYSVDGGTAAASYTAPTADGAHTVVVTDTDTAGNTVSTTLNFTLDNTIATPTVALTHDTGSSGSDNITKDASLTVSAAAGDVTRTYSVDGGIAAASYVAPTADGDHTVVVTDTDTAGNIATGSISFTLDSTIGTPTVALAHDTGSSSSDNITKDASITVSATATDVTRTYSVDGGIAAASYTAPTAEGDHSVVVTDTDTAGNTVSTTLNFTLDNAIATPAVALAHDTGSSASDNITKDASLTVSAAASDVTRTYSVDGGIASASYVAPTADGDHTVVVTDTDTAGNIATGSISFTLDNTIVTPTVALAHDTGSSSSDNITKDASITVSATATDVTRTYSVDGGIAAASYTAPTADGDHSVVVTDTDTAGNTVSTTLNFTLDNTIATPAVALAHDAGSSASDNITKDASLTVSAAASDVTRTYSVDGGIASASYVAPTADGDHTVVVTDTDTAGNIATGSISFTLDNTIVTPTVALAHDTGSSNSDNITKDASITVSATATDVTRTYSVDGGIAAASYIAPTADGDHTVVVTDTDTAGNTVSTTLNFTLDNTIATPTVALTHDTGSSGSDNITKDASLTVSAAAADVTRTYAVDGGTASADYIAPTADGDHSVVVTDTDTAGNTTSTSLSFTLDNTIATPTVALTHDTGISGSDNITKDAALAVSAAAGDVTRTYSVDGGTASASYVAPTADGDHTVVVTDTDTAGNIVTGSVSFILDNTIVTPTVALTHDTGSSNTDGITSDASLTVSAAAIDVTRTYTVDGGTATANYVAPTVDGDHTVVVTDTDTAGNTASASLSFTLQSVIATPTVALTHDTGSSATDNITKDASLTVSAPAADITRTYTVDGGTASASYVAPTADGDHTVVVTDTDTAGNIATGSLSFTLDNTIATPTVALAHDTGSSASDGITRDASLTVSAAASDVTRTYSVDGGTASATYAAPTADGDHTVVVTDTDIAGNIATGSVSFTLDNTIATPTVALAHDTGSSATDNITKDASLTVSAPAADITRTYTVDGGTASASYVAATADGDHTVVVTDTDTAGNTASATLNFTLDNTIATPTVALAHDTGSSASDNITKDASLTVSAAASDVTRTYSVDGGIAAANYVAPTADGDHTVVVTDTDTAGNIATGSISFTLDNSIATPTVTLTHDTGSSASDNITKDASLTVSAAATDVTRTYSVDGGIAAASYAAPTADGDHSVVVTDTDTAGNTISTSLNFTLDNTIATPTVALAHDTGTSDSDGITSDASLTVSAAAADVTRTYSVDGATASTTYAAPSTDGAHTVLVTDTDTAGNTASASLSFTLQNAIAVPTVALTHDTGSSAGDNITKDASLTVSAAAPDVTRSYTVDGGTASATYVAPTADGIHTVVVTDTNTAGVSASANLSFTLDNSIDTPTVALTHDTGSSDSDGITKDATLTVSTAASDVTRTYTVDGGTAATSYTAPTADGVHTVEVTDTDTAGNTITSSISFTLDNTIVTPTVALTNDTGSSGSDNITKDAALSFSTAATDVTRTYSVDGGTAAASYTAPDADGIHTVVVTDTDTAGNTTSASITFTLDNTIATPTVALTRDTGSSDSDGITSDASLTVSAAAGDVTRTYAVDGGTASASYVAPTTDGAHTVVVTDTDTAGNSASGSLTFTLQNAVATPTVALTHDTGSSSSDNITKDASLTVSAAAAGVTRTYTVDGGTAAATYTAPTADGVHTVLVTDVNTAGGSATASITFTLDNTIATPTVALTHDTGSSDSDGITSDASLTVSAAAGDVTRTYAVDGGTASASYVAPTTDGAHTVVVTDTDTAGNSASGSLTFTLQNAVATPTVALTHDTGSSSSDNITKDASLTVSAAAAGVTRTYTVDGGTAAATYTAPTADGVHTVLVTDVNTAGGSATASITFTLDNTIATPTVALTHDTGSSDSDGITSDASLTVSAAAGDVTRTYAVDGGTASASYVAPTTDGAHTVVVTDTDTAGNSASGSLTFTLQNAVATPTVALTHDTGSSSSDNITKDASLTVSAAAAGVTRTYTVDGGTAAATYTAPTADGVHTVLVTDVNTAGGSATASITFTLDNTIATPTVALTHDTGSSDSDGITSDASLTVSAAAGDVTRTYAVDGGTASASYVAPTTDGAHTVVVTDTDTAGNSASGSLTFTLQNAVATPTVALTHDTGSSSSDNITKDASLTVSAAAAGVTRTYTVDGGTAAATYTAPTTDGVHTVLVTDANTAGGSATASITFTLDTTADSAPTAAVDITPATIDGAGKTSVAYTIAGVDSDATASINFTSSGGGSVTVNALGNGPHTADLTSLSDGTVTASITLTDIAGNSATGIGDTASLSTSSGGITQTGTPGPDVMTGTPFDDTLSGLGGNDTLIGNGGNDHLLGGAGNDTFIYKVGDGADTMDGGAGTDSLYITGTTGDDTIHVVASGSTLTGLEGGTLTSIERVYLDLGAGNADTLSYAGTTANLNVNLLQSNATGFNSIAGVENVTGGSGADNLTGDTHDNVIDGGAGNDTITGGGGNDTIFGGAGNDLIIYKVGDGMDTIDGGAGTDTLEIDGTAGNDFINVVVTGSTITGLAGGTVTNVEKVELNLAGGTSDTLSFAGTTSNISVNLANQTGTGFTWVAGVENVTGGSGNDTLVGNAAANQLVGGAGNDKIDGGGGADTLTGGDGNDTFIYTTLANSRAAAFDTITDFTTGADKLQIGHALNGLTTGLTKTTGITGDLATDLASVLNNTNLKANGAAEVTIASGSDAGTYVIINDGAAGYKAGNDAVIKLAGAPLLHTTDFIV
ncbi:Ig-like domain-containing protein [Bradyrhizobium sp. CB1650]|uniref:Ig-like domain-containing protein n=1 Tax=Bradyrhizobium sp. CB1650 TaxID=3039153 RepID=UPI002435A11F|nr:Ig-like domain-containing protein [Bradyrhizobium sp. CB1650]WGD54678.1 Ig-like domain-containing protein [Bradyrhizobium sp. CB1650]